jgi:hypothetical protein
MDKFLIISLRFESSLEASYSSSEGRKGISEY